MAGLFAALAVGLLLPIWLTVRGSLVTPDGSWTTFYLWDALADPATRTGLLNAWWLAVATTAVSLLLGMPLAIVSTRFLFPGKGLANALILAPLVLPPFVGAIGMRHMMGREGAFNAILADLGIGPVDFLGEGGFWAIVVVQALHLYPIIYLNLAAALANIDPAVEEAAASLGAPWWTRLRRVLLPMARPGIFAGATIVFVWSLTELGTPLMFEYRMVTPVQIFDGLKDMETSRRPFALTVLMLVGVMVIYLLGKWSVGRSAGAAMSKASVQRVEHPLRGWRGVAALGLFLGVSALACVPHLGLILSSLSVEGAWYGTVLPQAWTLDNFHAALTHPLAVGSIHISVILSALGALLTVIIGVAAARVLVRSRLPGRGLLDALCMLPLAVPGLVMAFGYVALSLQWPFQGPMPGWMAGLLHWCLPGSAFDWLNSQPLHFVGDILGPDPNPLPFLVMTYAFRRVPYVVRSTVAGMEQTPVELEEAGQSVGAGRFTVLRRIVVPLVLANIVAGTLLAFSFNMLGVSEGLVLAQRESDYPVTKAIYSLAERLGDGPAVASAMGVWAMALLACALLGASALMGKKMGAVFRA